MLFPRCPQLVECISQWWCWVPHKCSEPNTHLSLLTHSLSKLSKHCLSGGQPNSIIGMSSSTSKAGYITGPLSSCGVQHFAFSLHLGSGLAVSHTHKAGKGSQTGRQSQYKALALYHNLPAPLNPEPGFHLQSVLSSAKSLLHVVSLCLLLLDQSTLSPEINRCGPWTIGTEILVTDMCVSPEVAHF